jgi:hypothetical protein
MMKTTSYIGMVLAAGVVVLGVLGAPGVGSPADATAPTYQGYRPQHRGPNDNDYHADYHADYSGTHERRPGPPKTTEEQPDPRLDARKFQDADRALRWRSGWRR